MRKLTEASRCGMGRHKTKYRYANAPDFAWVDYKCRCGRMIRRDLLAPMDRLIFMTAQAYAPAVEDSIFKKSALLGFLPAKARR